MSKYLTPVQQQLLATLTEADEVTKRSEQTKQSEQRLNFLLAKIKALQSTPLASANSSECRLAKAPCQRANGVLQ